MNTQPLLPRRTLLALPLALLLGGCSTRRSRRRRRSGRSGGAVSGGAPSTAPLKFNPKYRESSVALALMQVNTPYRYGGASPATGFDCSGLVYYVYGQILSAAERARLPRSAAQWAAASRPVASGQMRRGDLVFFNTAGRARYSHVGIYVGDGLFVHAPSTGKKVRKNSLSEKYYKQHFLGARSVFAD